MNIRLYKPNCHPNYHLVYEGPIEGSPERKLDSLEQLYLSGILPNGITFDNGDVVEVIKKKNTHISDSEFYFNNSGKIIPIAFNRDDILPALGERIIYRLKGELKFFQDWVQTQDAQTVYENAYKIVFMREIKSYLTHLIEDEQISDVLLAKIYEYEFILENLYNEWLSSSIDLQEPIETFLEDFFEVLWDNLPH